MKVHSALLIRLATSLLLVNSACGIDIDIDYRPEFSTNPDYDPNASRLIRLFDFAADFYMDVFEDTHNITINIWYEELSGTTLGRTTWYGSNPQAVADIKIDPGYSWFIDPTPENNSEFDMNQELWKDLDSEERSSFYYAGANIPNGFEVGYYGSALESGAAAGADVYDMLSVIMHEMGHALGVNSAGFDINDDGDYDFDPDFVFGRSLAAEGIDHLDNFYAVMYSGIRNAVRVLPSHTDLFSMASASGYTELDVPRREFYGGSDWNDDSNWSGNREPHSNDEVFVRDSNSVELTATALSAELHVLEGATVNMRAHSLTADGNINLDSGGRMFLSGGTLRATSGGRLRIGRKGQGRFTQNSGNLRLQNNLILGENVGSDGIYRLNGGTINISDNSTIEVGRSGHGELLQSGGVIDAPFMQVGRSVDGDGLFQNTGGVTRIQGAIEIGRAGTGIMKIRSGSAVSSNGGTVAANRGSLGSVSVAGNGARWTNSGLLRIGDLGSATLEISDRGLVTSLSASIGDGQGSDGEAIVTGPLSSWEVDADLTVAAKGSGMLTIKNGGAVGSFRAFVGAGSTGNGTVTVRGLGSEWTNDYRLYVGGDAANPGGRGILNILDEGRVFTEMLHIWPSGTVTLESGQLTSQSMDIREGVFNMTGGRLAPQTILGTLGNVAGILAPLGDSSGYALLQGDYRQSSVAKLEIGIGGTDFGQFDQLNVTNTANLDGYLEISLLSGFQPSVSDSFAILYAANLTGGFVNVTGGGRLVTVDRLGSFRVSYETLGTSDLTQVVLSDYRPKSPGDFNSDGDVDGRDFLAWQRNPSIGDLADWQASYGTNGLSALSVAIPEPKAGLLSAAALLFLTNLRCALRDYAQRAAILTRPTIA